MTFMAALSWMFHTYGRGRPNWDVAELTGGSLDADRAYITIVLRRRA